MARLVERATSGGAASSLQAVSSFSDAATAMSVAPVFLPPLSPGLYLPPTRYNTHNRVMRLMLLLYLTTCLWPPL